jgi:cation diffusion facilitator family transporter
MFSTKKGAAQLLLITAIGLIILKSIASVLTGSISILAQGADSLMDVFAGLVSYSTIKVSEQPADEQHPYGHGKAEDMGGMVQALLLFGAGAFIIYSAIRRIIEKAPVESPEAGIVVMVFSIVVSLLLSRHLKKVARRTDSVVLTANADNIRGDVFSAIAVLAGLLLVKMTGISYIDSIMAIGVALYVWISGYRAMRESVSGLVDVRLPPEDELVIKEVLREHGNEIAGFHKLRTRHVGSQHNLDFHVLLNPDLSLNLSHEIAEKIETEIEERLPESSVVIHMEPCEGHCSVCRATCERRA